MFSKLHFKFFIYYLSKHKDFPKKIIKSVKNIDYNLINK